eukprot:gene28950-35966_t
MASRMSEAVGVELLTWPSLCAVVMVMSGGEWSVVKGTGNIPDVVKSGCGEGADGADNVIHLLQDNLIFEPMSLYCHNNVEYITLSSTTTGSPANNDNDRNHIYQRATTYGHICGYNKGTVWVTWQKVELDLIAFRVRANTVDFTASTDNPVCDSGAQWGVAWQCRTNSDIIWTRSNMDLTGTNLMISGQRNQFTVSGWLPYGRLYACDSGSHVLINTFNYAQTNSIGQSYRCLSVDGRGECGTAQTVSTATNGGAYVAIEVETRCTGKPSGSYYTGTDCAYIS